MKRHCLIFVSCLMACLFANAQTGQFFSSDRFSSSLINDLCQDRQGSIWIATDYGLNRFDGYTFQTFLHEPADSTSLADNMCVSLLNDRDGRLWVGTHLGLDRFDAATESFIHYPFPDAVQPRVTALFQLHDGRLFVGTAGYGAYVVDNDSPDRLLPYHAPAGDTFFSRVYEDSQGRLWHSGFDETITMEYQGKTTTFRSERGNPQAFVEQDGELLVVCLRGIMVYRGGEMQVADIDMSIAQGRDLIFWKAVAAPSGTVYLGTRGRGGFCIAPDVKRRLEVFDVNAYDVNLQTAKVSAMMFDAKGNLWLACHRKGLVMVSLRSEQFQNWSFEAQGIRLGSTISSVCEGDGDMMWATVQGVGIYGFNGKGRVVAHPSSPNAVEFIFRDRQRRYWVGTDDALFDYDPLSGRSSLRVSFDCDRFNDMTSDDEGNIFISTFSRGFCVFNTKTGLLRNFSMDDEGDSIRGRLCNNWILAMMPDRQGRLWMATSSGVSCYDPKGDTFRPFGWMQLLPGVMCYSLCETSKGHILIGTDNGLFVYEPGHAEATLFSGSDALGGKVVTYIVETNDGDLWCSTSMGLWQYDNITHEFIGHVAGNGLMKKEYIMNVGIHTDNDRVFFGHNDGFTVFSPQQMKSKHTVLPDTLQLTAFRVGGQFVSATTVLNGVAVTDGSPVSACDNFTLSYLDHTVTMAFSQFNFETAMNVSLEYRLNSDNWIRQAAGNNEISLAHLQPGTYRVEVRACQGGDCSPSKVFTITVRAPWYRTTMAFCLYLLALLALLLFLGLMFRRKARQQLDEEKMKFLINATHDIRSPLTIILASLKKLKGVAKGADGGALEAIENNSKRILNLVNQILDVRKIDKQQMMLHCQKTDLVKFVAGVCKMYEFNAVEQNITFRFEHDELEKLPAWVDRSQFDKVISNLLSNAFKYCNEGGEITVALSAPIVETEEEGENPPMAYLTVADTGVGLDSESLRHIFDRFYQGENSRNQNIEGTGIGLNLCKMIVDMHHGNITAANRTDGRHGSIFTVELPLGKSHLKPEEIDTNSHEEKTVQQQTASRKKVLIVDDDQELARYVSHELGHYYKFTYAPNGREGLKELLMGDYDAVVSDVMMPEMDGFTLLRLIKQNMNVSHLPVIMLTSKADVAGRLEGLERGADAFLAKPFDMEELHATIENLIQTRLRLKGKFTGAQQQTERVEPVELKGNNEQLMERIMKAVNKNLDDSDFSVEQLCQEVGISRAQLHRKMKEMTGLSTSEFIRNIRLEQAARLLKEQKVNVTQVAYSVGFSNLAHFSTVFRKHFGVAPSEYANMKGEG